MRAVAVKYRSVPKCPSLPALPAELLHPHVTVRQAALDETPISGMVARLLWLRERFPEVLPALRKSGGTRRNR